MNLHGMRQKEARAAYFRYAEQCKTPEGRKALQDALILRYDRFHPRPDKMRKASLKKSDTQRSRFLRSIEDRPIRLRSSKEIAIRDGMPVIYDRTAVMAVSVFCLSHWRSDVTITNYLIWYIWLKIFMAFYCNIRNTIVFFNKLQQDRARHKKTAKRCKESALYGNLCITKEGLEMKIIALSNQKMYSNKEMLLIS